MTRSSVTVRIHVKSLQHLPAQSPLQKSTDHVVPGPAVHVADVVVLGSRRVFLPLLGCKQKYSSRGKWLETSDTSQTLSAQTSRQTNTEVAERLNKLANRFEKSLAMFVHQGLSV